MSRSSLTDIALPHLTDLGRDLLTTTSWQRWQSLLRPCLGIAAYAAAVFWDQWWLTPFLVFLIFVAVVTATHDVVHGSLGLGPRATEWWLFLLGAVLLESGHAYRTTHLRHHQVFPGSDDPEGDPARLSFWRAVFYGPIFLPRLWLWAFRRQAGRLDQRLWLLLEASWALGLAATSVLLWPVTLALMWYVFLALLGSWVYPLLTVHLPHHGYKDAPLTQTGTMRGRLIPALFLELTYHLEHHLYPGVPSHHLGELSQRLDPFFQANGVIPRRVP